MSILTRPDAGPGAGDGLGDAGAIPPPSLINIANGLTVGRMALVPVFVVLLLTDRKSVV